MYNKSLSSYDTIYLIFLTIFLIFFAVYSCKSTSLIYQDYLNDNLVIRIYTNNNLCPEIYKVTIEVNNNNHSQIQLLGENLQCTISFLIQKEKEKLYMQKILFQEKQNLHSFSQKNIINIENIGWGKKLLWNFNIGNRNFHANFVMNNNKQRLYKIF